MTASEDIERELAALGPTPADVKALIVSHLGAERLTLDHADALLASLADRLPDLPLPIALPFETRPLFGTPAAAHEVSALFDSRPPAAMETPSPFDLTAGLEAARAISVFDAAPPAEHEETAEAIVAAFGAPESDKTDLMADAAPGMDAGRDTWEEPEHAESSLEAESLIELIADDEDIDDDLLDSAFAEAHGGEDSDEDVHAHEDAHEHEHEHVDEHEDHDEHELARFAQEDEERDEVLGGQGPQYEEVGQLGLRAFDSRRPGAAGSELDEPDADLPAVLSDPASFLEGAKRRSYAPRSIPPVSREQLEPALQFARSEQPPAAADESDELEAAPPAAAAPADADAHDDDDFEILVDDDVLEISDEDVELVDDDKR